VGQCATPVAADSIPASASELHKLRESPCYTRLSPRRISRWQRAQRTAAGDWLLDHSDQLHTLVRAIVSRHVEDAVSKGAKVLTGGKVRDKGLFYEPTMLVDVDHGMDCMREETFGPTLPVMKVRDAAEAIEKANDSRLGLAGSIWTRDKAKAMALARQMNTGTVTLNNVLVGIFQFGVPFGGWNDSGVGSRSGGAEGIRKYCRAKALWPNGSP